MESLESNARFLISATVVECREQSKIIEITPGFADGPWQMELFDRVAEPMGREKAAAYVTERYLIAHPYQLEKAGRAAIATAVLYALTPESEWPEALAIG